MSSRTGYPATVFLFVLFLFWYIYLKKKKKKLIAYQREFLALRERLRVAEHRTLQRSSELNSILEQFRHAVADTNGSRNALSRFSDETQRLLEELTGKKALQVPNIYHYLPHLSNDNGLQPAVQVGLGRTGVSVVMGIPTVKRKVKSYLQETLHSLIDKLSPEERLDCVIVVFIGETDLDYVHSVVGSLEKEFSIEINSGLLEVISPPASYYPDLTNLKETFGDTKERVKWRTKQNLDYCFLMMYAQRKGVYYIQASHVAELKKKIYIKNSASNLACQDILILQTGGVFFFCKMFQSPDLNLIVEFIFMFYKEKPIDWLLDHILWVKVCNPEKDAKHCERQKSNLRIRFRPSLFQHVGLHSSLPGKIQKLTDKDFLKPLLHKIHVNPPAEVSSTLKVYQDHTLEKTYLGVDFFWAITPLAGDYILLKFDKPINVESYLFHSGNSQHPGDILLNTTVEVLPFAHEGSEIKQETKEKYKRTEDGFFITGSFVNGEAEGPVDPSLNPISAIRLSVLKDSPVWAILNEIHVKKAN
uniref:Alpha-1,3-mannosyl-glycoprotein 4-beta-N-acetylglucosaminyltransferase A n=1 Tax=Latimeria chalumnae TaxID=7897 RepID=H3AA99_LATCH